MQNLSIKLTSKGNSMKIRARVIICLLLLLILPGCRKWDRPDCANQDQCTEFVLYDELSLLPSWNGIIPSKTSFDEALNILNSLDFLTDIVHNDSPTNGFDDCLIFHEKLQAWNAEICFIGDIVVESCFRGDLSLDFKTVENSIELNKVLIYYDNYMGGVIYTFNFDKGIALGTNDYYTSFYSSNKLKPNTEVNEIILFDPSKTEVMIQLERFINNNFDKGDFWSNLQDWKGYGKPKELYKLVEFKKY